MNGSSDYAAELHAMGAVMEALAPLDRTSQESVLRWVLDKLNLEIALPAPEAQNADFSGEPPAGTIRESQRPGRAGTINTVATKIGADSCRTVLIAAALHLTLYQAKDAFSRAELVGLARSAKVWKADYTNQTSTMISRLADAGILVEKGKDMYFLSDDAVAQYNAALS